MGNLIAKEMCGTAVPGCARLHSTILLEVVLKAVAENPYLLCREWPRVRCRI